MIQDGKTINQLQKSWDISPNINQRERCHSTFVSLFSFICRKKANLFLVKRKTVFQNPLSLPVTYSETQELYLWKNQTANILLNLHSIRRSSPPIITHLSHLYPVLFAHLNPPRTPRGWGMGNQDRSHYFLGNTASTNSWSAPMAPMNDPLPSFFTLPPFPLPPPISYEKEMISFSYLKLSSVFYCSFINI